MIDAVTIYAETEASCFACAPKHMKQDEIIASVTAKNPLPEGDWIIRPYRVFVGGEKQGIQCEIDTKCRHWFVEAY